MRRCVVCGAPYEAVRANALYCGPTCKKRAQRHPLAVLSPAAGGDLSPPDRPTTVRDSVRSDLAAAGRDASYLGSIALGLASQIDASFGGMGVAALVKELKATMTAALAGPFGPPADLVDELRARRDQVRHARTPSSAKDRHQ